MLTKMGFYFIRILEGYEKLNSFNHFLVKPFEIEINGSKLHCQNIL